MKIITKPNSLPYSWQNHCMQNLSMYNVLVAPRQHGKSHLIKEVAKLVAYNPAIKNPVINFCSDTSKRIYRLYAHHLRDAFGHHPDFNYSNENITSTGFTRHQGDYVTINILGSIANPTGPKGTAGHLCVIDETGLVSYKFIKEGTLPAIGKTGGIFIATGTVEPNQYWDLYREATKKMNAGSPHWFSFYMKFKDHWSRQVHSQDSLDAIDAGYDFSNPRDVLIYDKEYMCNWMAGMEGTPYAKYMSKIDQKKQITNIPISPHYPVGTTWDDGRGTTAVWFWQFIEGKFRFVDCMEWYEGSLPQICSDIMDWYKLRKVKMGFHVLPHTMAEKSYQMASKISRRDQVRELFQRRGKYIPMSKVGNIETKLTAGKEFIERCWFDQERCASGIQSLFMYSRVVNRGTSTPSRKIKDDQYAHFGDAFGELALAFKLGRFGPELHRNHILEFNTYKGFTYPY